MLSLEFARAQVRALEADLQRPRYREVTPTRRRVRHLVRRTGR